MGTDVVTVTTTIDDRDKAKDLARVVVGERLAACAQVSGPVTSVYWWQSEIEEAAEFTVTFKTTAALAEALVTRLKAKHSYDVPEILVTAVVGGNPDYLEWVAAEAMSPAE